MWTAEERVPGDLPLWQVPGWRERFGILAGITGRGADPAAPFDLGLWTDQPVGGVMGRWRALRSALTGCTGLVMAHQIHGDRVLWHDTNAGGWTIHDGADGHATASRGLCLIVTVADCVPVYLAAPSHGAIALLHAGWRGTAAGILERGVALLHEKCGASPSDLIMHAGVAIAGPCYEVGAEVMTGVGKAAEGPGPWHLDIRGVLLDQAADLGLGEATASTRCTASATQDFFSHRASGGLDGRQVAYLAMP